jgi:hypothetical protein
MQRYQEYIAIHLNTCYEDFLFFRKKNQLQSVQQSFKITVHRRNSRLFVFLKKKQRRNNAVVPVYDSSCCYEFEKSYEHFSCLLLYYFANNVNFILFHLITIELQRTFATVFFPPLITASGLNFTEHARKSRDHLIFILYFNGRKKSYSTSIAVRHEMTITNMF